ncbi:MAG: hypothetical protein DRN06_02960 [Thermoprotei archaeon]|nr:MAG: hypothetical protein DRN06_02960 [Thermoprotei archaeon]
MREQVYQHKIFRESNEGEWYLLIPIADIHVGNPLFDRDKFEEIIEWMSKVYDKGLRDGMFDIPPRHIFWVGLGDYGDWISSDPRDMRFMLETAEEMKPEEQFKYLRNWLGKIRHFCLGLIEGNHERKFYQLNNVNFTRLLAEELDVPYLGSRATISLMFVRKGKHTINYLIHVAHPMTRAYTHIGLSRVAERIIADVFADVYLLGHTHRKLTGPKIRWIYDKKYGIFRKHKSVYAYAGSFLNPLKGDGYPDYKAYSPTDIGIVSIFLNAERKDIHVLV